MGGAAEEKDLEEEQNLKPILEKILKLGKNLRDIDVRVLKDDSGVSPLERHCSHLWAEDVLAGAEEAAVNAEDVKLISNH